jgi:hypothetical protein
MTRHRPALIMTAIHLLRRMVFVLGFVLSGACAAAQGNAAATDLPKSPVGEKTVPPDQVLVKAAPDYQAIEPGWYRAKTAHFDVSTKDAKNGPLDPQSSYLFAKARFRCAPTGEHAPGFTS